MEETDSLRSTFLILIHFPLLMRFQSFVVIGFFEIMVFTRIPTTGNLSDSTSVSVQDVDTIPGIRDGASITVLNVVPLWEWKCL